MMNNSSKVVSETVVIDGKTFTFQVGRFPTQANGAVEVRVGDTIVLATAVASRRDTILNYFPLQVEYQEKLYAGGKIKGSRWVKREGRPSDEAILTARLIDRSIRPLFPKEFKKDVQVVVTVLSVDGENDPDMPALMAASAALSVSNIPWFGPVAAVRIGFKDKTYFANPSYEERKFSDLDLIVSGTQKAIVMVEAGANEVTEEVITPAFAHAQKAIEQITQTIKKLTEKVGKEKISVVKKEVDQEFVEEVEKEVRKPIEEILSKGQKGNYDPTILWSIKDALKEKYEDKGSEAAQVADDVWYELARKQTLEKAIRVDGRKLDQIRTITVEAGVLPRTHGSAIFRRGSTHALTITTLGSPSEGQLLETMIGEETKRYIHHYIMPPYSVGETGRMGWPSRREIGHGALSERALMPMLPALDKFPYTIRIVSEITSSNGSTSMASVCGSTLSLMDAGVPIKKPVAGAAMGLIVSDKIKKADPDKTIEITDKDYVILTDIMGEEDHLGDMDFKVAGTRDGITALQMDIKILGVNQQILKKALQAALKARLFILGEMTKVLPLPREKLSKYAPKISVLHIPVDKIGEVIGPGGKVIRNIINTTGCTVDVEDDGSVTIAGTDPAAVTKAITWVDSLTRELKPGEEYEEGLVKRILPFGAFVEVLPGREGLVHVSQMPGHPQSAEQVVHVGQKVKVRVAEIDNLGRVNLSMLFGDQITQSQSQPRRQDDTMGRFKRPFRPGGNRGGYRR